MKMPNKILGQEYPTPEITATILPVVLSSLAMLLPEEALSTFRSHSAWL